MKLFCVWEHNGADSLVFVENLPGAFSRGASKEEALAKIPVEAGAWLRWAGKQKSENFQMEVIQEISTDAEIRDGDSNGLFEREKLPLTMEEYERMKRLSLRSAQDFLRLYQAVPDKEKTCLPARKTFYGQVPRTAEAMYQHTKQVNVYYFGEIGVEADNEGDIVQCRERGFALLEQQPRFLENPLFLGSYDEEWTLRKVLRRFLWHDRIHAKALTRMVRKTFDCQAVPNVFQFAPSQIDL